MSLEVDGAATQFLISLEEVIQDGFTMAPSFSSQLPNFPKTSTKNVPAQEASSTMEFQEVPPGRAPGFFSGQRRVGNFFGTMTPTFYGDIIFP